MVDALLSNTSSTINGSLFLNFFQQWGAGGVEFGLGAQDITFEKPCAYILCPPAFAGHQYLILHHCRGAAHIEKIDIATCDLRQLATEMPEFNSIYADPGQDSKIKIAVLIGGPCNTASKRIYR